MKYEEIIKQMDSMKTTNTQTMTELLSSNNIEFEELSHKETGHKYFIFKTNNQWNNIYHTLHFDEQENLEDIYNNYFHKPKDSKTIVAEYWKITLGS